MSGYRLIHRAHVWEDDDDDTAVWSLVTTPLLLRRRRRVGTTATHDEATTPPWRIWAAGSDGTIRTYVAQEVSLAQKQATLTASALSLRLTHVLVASNDNHNHESSAVALGCTSLSLLRNYAGQDEATGNVVVAGMDLSGTLRLWELDEHMDDDIMDATGTENDSATDHPPPIRLPAPIEIPCPRSTGTAVALAPPRTVPVGGTVGTAVAYLDGTVSLLSTGLAIPHTAAAAAASNTTTPTVAAGTVWQSWGTGSAPACRLVFRPGQPQLAVSRHDGTVDLIPISSSNQANNNDNTRQSSSSQRFHRLNQLATAPTRGLAFTTDGHLLVGGNDDGRIVLWDVSRPNGVVPVVVNHQVQAPLSDTAWLWQCAALDARRFVSLATDQTIRVWQVDSVHHQPLHTFTSSDEEEMRLWSMSTRALEDRAASTTTATSSSTHPPRLVAGSENGWLQIFSLAEKA